MAMEGTVDREATSLEGMEGQETVASTTATGTSEVAMVVVDQVLEALAVVEAHLDRHPRVVGHPTRTGMDGRTHVRREASIS